MSDLQRYITKRKKSDSDFAKDYEKGFMDFKIGALLRQAREKAGLSQETIAIKLRTKKSAISRLENHAEDIRLSTLEKYAMAVGRKLLVEVK